MLELSPENLDWSLDILARAGRILASPAGLADSLSQIAKLCVGTFAAYTSIEVSIEVLERSVFLIEEGTCPAGSAERVLEPLLARRRVFGSISCIMGDRPITPGLRQTIHILALQLSVAIASQAAVLREHRIADHFQRALLPDRMPDVDGLEFSAAYRPASDEAEVGGDWYDAFEVSDGRIAISIGDVAGHGLAAAVIMGEVRQAMRTAAVASRSPSEVLEHVNGAVRLRDSIGMVTAVFALYDPRTNVISYSIAGHPPPILALPGGFARALPVGGMPLGCAPSLDARDWTFTLPKDALLVFYTDGLIENDRDLDRGEKELLAVVRGLSHTPPQERADVVLARIFADVSNRDDAAVITLAVQREAPSYLFTALPIAAPLARAILARELEKTPVPAEKHFGALLAVSEAVANVVEHAYRGEEPGHLRLTLDRDAGGVTIAVEDYGRWRPFARHEEAGRGIELMHAFTDGVQIHSSRQSTKISLRIASAEDAVAQPSG